MPRTPEAAAAVRDATSNGLRTAAVLSLAPLQFSTTRVSLGPNVSGRSCGEVFRVGGSGEVTQAEQAAPTVSP